MKKSLSTFFLSVFTVLSLVGCHKEVPTTPVLSTEATSISDVYVNESVTLPVVTASDEHDGDLTSDIICKVKDPNAAETTVTAATYTATIIGNYTVTYSVTNSYGNSDTKSFSFAAKDYDAPTLTFADSHAFDDVYVGTTFNVPTPTVTDSYDTNLTATCVVKDKDGNAVTVSDNNQFVANVIGQYTFEYSVTNSKGKSEVNPQSWTTN